MNKKGYAFLRLLGKGGMGEVYEACDEDGRHVAVKVFSVDRSRSDFLRKRFAAEARILRRLSHPNLVRVRDVGVDGEAGRPYYAMDLVLNAAGEPMTLEARRKAGALDETDLERWYLEITQAVAYCHAQGVVHRDIKLENVLLDEKGRAILSDFGISHIFDERVREELQVTTTFIEGETTGTKPVMGTYWYLAPEIRKGESATPASDWYAVGVLFFRLLTGIWYEPGTQALELLAPFDPIWRDRLASLLDGDASKRLPPAPLLDEDASKRLPPAPSLEEVPSKCIPRACGISRSPRYRFWVLCSLPLLVAVTLVVVGLLSPSPSAPAITAPDTPRIACTLDAHTTFVFCRCPPGTNALGTISIAVSRPYWLGRTPVTRRQWFAVRGEPLVAWEGGADAPMTYVSREEVTDFCARLNARFAARLPPGYEIRLPTLAEWRLAYAQGKTVPEDFPDLQAKRQAHAARGWFGQGLNGEAKYSNMRAYYAGLNRPVPLVTNIWRAFPPHVVCPGKDEWERYSSQIPPVPVGLKPANDLGLQDMLGNCFERTFDTCSAREHAWGKTEWAVTTHGLYTGMGLSVTDPVERSGDYPLMLGSYFAMDLDGDRAWSAPFDRLPHLGFRLCIGPALADRHHKCDNESD